MVFFNVYDRKLLRFVRLSQFLDVEVQFSFVFFKKVQKPL